MSYTLPVTVNFKEGSEDLIGELTIYDDNFKIPLNSVFALGVKILRVEKASEPGGAEITHGEVKEISLIPDANYQKYLKLQEEK